LGAVALNYLYFQEIDPRSNSNMLFLQLCIYSKVEFNQFIAMAIYFLTWSNLTVLYLQHVPIRPVHSFGPGHSNGSLLFLLYLVDFDQLTAMDQLIAMVLYLLYFTLVDQFRALYQLIAMALYFIFFTLLGRSLMSDLQQYVLFNTAFLNHIFS
jgi:hypothetical protein